MGSHSWRPQSVDSYDRYGRAIAAFLAKNQEASTCFVEERPIRNGWFARHSFRLAANICIDERVQDIGEALGLPIGVPELYRAGGSKSDLSSYPYAKRCFEGVARIAGIRCDGSGRPDARACVERISRTGLAPCEGPSVSMVEMRMVTAHFSQAHPNSHSCAAWNHQTEQAIEAMRGRASDLNFAFRGRMVAFPVLIDTDLDALTLLGVGGERFAVREEIDRSFFSYGSEADLLKRLRVLYPPDWEPLQALEPAFREAFHPELAERVYANERYVRRVAGRPPELLDHKGELVFVGRHADWIREHNSVFLIDDTEDKPDVLAYFGLALRYVARNVIRRAIVNGDDDWVVPVVINIPYDGSQDERVTQLYAHKLRLDLERHAQQISGDAVSWILDGPQAISPMEVPDKVFRQIHRLRDRIRFMTSVSQRSDRLFRPFE